MLRFTKLHLVLTTTLWGRLTLRGNSLDQSYLGCYSGERLGSLVKTTAGLWSLLVTLGLSLQPGLYASSLDSYLYKIKFCLFRARKAGCGLGKLPPNANILHPHIPSAKAARRAESAPNRGPQTAHRPGLTWPGRSCRSPPLPPPPPPPATACRIPHTQPFSEAGTRQTGGRPLPFARPCNQRRRSYAPGSLKTRAFQTPLRVAHPNARNNPAHQLPCLLPGIVSLHRL